jgi:hypothetical protein
LAGYFIEAISLEGFGLAREHGHQLCIAFFLAPGTLGFRLLVDRPASAHRNLIAYKDGAAAGP